MDESALDIAFLLERHILNGVPFDFPCGCFGMVVEAHPLNADWLRVHSIKRCSGDRHLGDVAFHVVGWRTREGDLITLKEFHQR